MTDALDIAMPEKSAIRHAIIAGVLKRHRVTLEELTSRCKLAEAVAARKEAARLLLDAQFTPRRVGEILKRDRSTVEYWFNPISTEKKRERKRVYKILYSLEPDVREVVDQFAQAENVSPQTIVREWIAERARHEAATKARAA